MKIINEETKCNLCKKIVVKGKTPLRIMFFFKLCPFWKRHALTIWNFEKIEDFHWWCMDCPLKAMGDVGRAYRKTVEQSIERD